jgi:hypothetical protein
MIRNTVEVLHTKKEKTGTFIVGNLEIDDDDRLST